MGQILPYGDWLAKKRLCFVADVTAGTGFQAL
jgi:hypothetical protein